MLRNSLLSTDCLFLLFRLYSIQTVTRQTTTSHSQQSAPKLPAYKPLFRHPTAFELCGQWSVDTWIHWANMVGVHQVSVKTGHIITAWFVNSILSGIKWVIECCHISDNVLKVCWWERPPTGYSLATVLCFVLWYVSASAYGASIGSITDGQLMGILMFCWPCISVINQLNAQDLVL